MKKFYIHTMGCKANQFESAIIKENLIKNGLQMAENIETADIFVLNSCTVTGKSDHEALYILRNIELIPEIKDEIINIRNYNSSKKLAKDIIKFYSKPYSQFCNYCNATNIETNLTCGEQA